MPVSPLSTAEEISRAASAAVAHHWLTRKRQQERQRSVGHADQGFRGAVTGGAQMDGFLQLFTRIIGDAGIGTECVFYEKALELPGFYRPTKEWDLLVIKDNHLIAALEAKSQVAPSFGNSFNNRTEEAMGSAVDLWTAFREGAFNNGGQPFLGYFFMLEDCPASQAPVHVQEPHFKVFPEFVGASYAKRYELFCRKLVRERQYTAAAFITSRSDTGSSGLYREPAADLSLLGFLRALSVHVAAYV